MGEDWGSGGGGKGENGRMDVDGDVDVDEVRRVVSKAGVDVVAACTRATTTTTTTTTTSTSTTTSPPKKAKAAASNDDATAVAEEEHVEVLVLGAGPTGLGAATRLETLRRSDGKWTYAVVDKEHKAGGLAITDATPEGFLFDVGGHVIFSHYDYFDALLQASLGPFADAKAWLTHQRESFVRYKHTWVPYPYQNNLKDLPAEDQIAAINGMIDARVRAAEAGPNAPLPANFDEWILRTMGEGIAEQFMRPYNFKVWATPPAQMHWNWLGERVAVVDVKRAVTNAIKRVADVGWGPNATFTFPVRGGTGAIWEAVASKFVGSDAMRLGWRVVGVDLEAKVVEMVQDAGRRRLVRYNRLLNTLPLDVFVGLCRGFSSESEEKEVSKAKEMLWHSSTHVVGLGVRGPNPHGSKCWLYFPEDNCPFYRATVFSNYAPEGNVPAAGVRLRTLRLAGGGGVDAAAREGPYWSLMLEVSESARFKPVDATRVVEDVINGCVATGLLRPEDEIVSTHHRRVEYGYPTPSLERDAALVRLLPMLRAKSVWSRGRFGSWRYEVANQDHSLALGVECVDNMAFGTEEVTLTRAAFVNRQVGSMKNATPEFGVLPAPKSKLTSSRGGGEEVPPHNGFVVGSAAFEVRGEGAAAQSLRGKSFTNVRELEQFGELVLSSLSVQ